MPYILKRAPLVAQMIKNLPAMQETLVGSLSQENPLEKGMTTTPVFLVGESYEYNSLTYGIWSIGLQRARQLSE